MNNKITPFMEIYDQQGYIENEATLLMQLKELDEKKDRREISSILTLAALSKEFKKKQSSLAAAWMQKALELDESNEQAAQYLSQYDWESKLSLLDSLKFPALRETDNRAAKKTTARQFIDTSRTFLAVAEDEIEQMRKLVHRAEKRNDQNALKIYSSLLIILEKAAEETAGLLKASEEYEQSISGVFHTSTFYDDMKKHMDQITLLKKDWQAFFASYEHTRQPEKKPMDELHDMVGLATVKTRIEDYYRYLKYQNERKKLGFQTKDGISLHMVLTGNPGTGKTTLARLLAKIYYDLGALPRKEVVETDRTQLVGAFVGQTEENVRAVVEKALGGILFIDEAYTLKRGDGSGNDYGQTAIDTLVSLMTSAEYGGKFAVILAGYPEEMRIFLDANPGLRSRFPSSNHIALPDYTNEELLTIAKLFAEENDYIFTDEAKTELVKRIENERVDDSFGNARTVRDIVLNAIFKKGAKAGDCDAILCFTLLEKEDFAVPASMGKTKPSEQLRQLIGLENVKQEVTKLITFVRMQQIRREQGLPALPLQLHSVFTGNPGTGKTTVANIYASLLKECGMLKRGHLIVASRADFVAGYVGQTAIKTKKMIKQALGGVLFIDEAYSLLSQTSGDFGKEVIDTLVDEMTKHNENLVVILAGYPNEMDMLLESNPGLKSRFKKFYHFQDYTAKELAWIMKNYIEKYQYELSEEAESYVLEEITALQPKGNGRFAANLADEAIQAQAVRVLANETPVKGVSMIEKEDFAKALQLFGRGE